MAYRNVTTAGSLSQTRIDEINKELDELDIFLSDLEAKRGITPPPFPPIKK